MMNDHLVQAYVATFGTNRRLESAAHYAKIPISILSEILKGHKRGFSTRHGYNPMERLEDAIYQRLPNSVIRRLEDEAMGHHGAVVATVNIKDGVLGEVTRITLPERSRDLIMSGPAQFTPMKHCSACGKDKDQVVFNKNASKPDGLQSECRECQSKQKRQMGTPREADLTLTFPIVNMTTITTDGPQNDPETTVQESLLSIHGAARNIAMAVSALSKQAQQGDQANRAYREILEDNLKLQEQLEQAQGEQAAAYELLGSAGGDKMEEENATLKEENARLTRAMVTLKREIARLRG